MQIEIKIPNVGESITQVEIGEWLKSAGETVRKNENLVLLETDKATVEITAPEAGTLTEVLKQAGDSASIGEVVARLETDGGAATKAPAAPLEEPAPPAAENAAAAAREDGNGGLPEAAPSEPRGATERFPQEEERLEDRAIEIIGAKERAAQETQDAEVLEEPAPAPAAQPREQEAGHEGATGEGEESVRMSALRRRIAERLVAAQQQAALLTTFNEIDMAAVTALRQAEGPGFEQKHRVKLGFMSFFVKAAVSALRTIREINAEIRGDRIVYHKQCDIGIAVGGGKGLVVPVLRRAEGLSFAEIERSIADFAKRARENALRPDELQGGTFTITNGGVFGSLFSTPIINPPQSGILGLHAIQDRPVAHDGQVVVKPMMYVALTYDHRIVDGREAVLFLKQIKTLIEQPARLLLEM